MPTSRPETRIYGYGVTQWAYTDSPGKNLSYIES